VPKVSAPAFGIDIFWWTRPRPLCPTPNPPPQGREPRPLWPVYFLLPLLPVAYFFQSQLLPCACWEGRVRGEHGADARRAGSGRGDAAARAELPRVHLRGAGGEFLVVDPLVFGD